MANGLQRAIYNFANAVPLAIMTALVWYFEFKSWYIPVILFFTAISVIVIFTICFYYGKNNCSIKSINVLKITSKDSWTITYVIAYVFPFSYMIINDFNIVLFIVFCLMLVLVFMPAITAFPNVILFFIGYHFYEIETENTGIGDYIFISKRRIRNKTEIRMVTRIYEKLLIDAKENKRSV